MHLAMNRIRHRSLLLAVLLTAAPLPLAARAASSVEEQARFLAGLANSPESPLAALEQSRRWREHAHAMDGAWTKMAERLALMDTWAAREVRPRIQVSLPVLYLFGGPDVITPITLYPDAPIYLLAGLEPVGQAPPPEALKPAALDAALDGLHEALRSVVPSSFFRTIEMGHDLRGQAIDGVQPLAYLFLERAGARILSAEQIEIDPLGLAKVKEEGEKWGPGLPGLRIRFQRDGHVAQELVYVRVDLGNEAMTQTPGFVPYVQALGPANAVLKAASFILHDNRFSRARDLLLASAVSVLQDDSGAPLRAFKKGEWEFTPFGTYLVPKRPFQRNWQSELAKLFETVKPAPLPFTYGYRHGAAESSLLLAVKKPKGG